MSVEYLGNNFSNIEINPSNSRRDLSDLMINTRGENSTFSVPSNGDILIYDSGIAIISSDKKRRLSKNNQKTRSDYFFNDKA